MAFLFQIFIIKNLSFIGSAKTILKEFADICRKLDIGRIAIRKV